MAYAPKYKKTFVEEKLKTEEYFNSVSEKICQFENNLKEEISNINLKVKNLWLMVIYNLVILITEKK